MMDLRTASDFIPDNWADCLASGNMVSLGLDVASTVKKKSNPSGLAVMQRRGTEFHVPLEMRWKTKTKDVFFSILKGVIDMIPPAKRLALVVDSSNEKLFAESVRTELSSLIRVILVAGGDKVQYKGKDWQAKRLLGALLCNAYEDGVIAIPDVPWLLDDHRLVKREGDSFDADVDANGCHADNFDGEKLALWGHVGASVKVEAQGANTLGGNSTQKTYDNMSRLERQMALYNERRFNS